MGKYEPLRTFLKGLPASCNVQTLTFSTIEGICGPLPASARLYPEWWANNRAKHVQARTWLDAGWRAESPDLRSERVTFVRQGQGIGYPVEQKSYLPSRPAKSKAKEFEQMAKESMSRHFQTELQPSKVGEIPKDFDMVSPNKDVVGDAKCLSMVKGHRIPPAKFSVIAEYVWLLEKVPSKQRFLVFGNDKRVPMEWLKRYGHLVRGISFFFLDKSGKLQKLK